MIQKYSKLRHDYTHLNSKYLDQLTFIKKGDFLFAVFAVYNIIWIIFIAKSKKPSTPFLTQNLATEIIARIEC